MASLNLPFGVKVLNPLPLDYYRGPWASLAIARTEVPLSVRHDGLTVKILGLGEYWWLQADLSDSGLTPKGANLTANDGILLTGTNFTLGGPTTGSSNLTSDRYIDGNFSLIFGQTTPLKRFDVEVEDGSDFSYLDLNPAKLEFAGISGGNAIRFNSRVADGLTWEDDLNRPFKYLGAYDVSTDNDVPRWGETKAKLRGFPLALPTVTEDGKVPSWNNSTQEWDYITPSGGASSVDIKNQSYSGDGVTTSFVLSETGTVYIGFVDVGGVLLRPTTDYTKNNGTYTVNIPVAPLVGQTIVVYYTGGNGGTTTTTSTSSTSTTSTTTTIPPTTTTTTTAVSWILNGGIWNDGQVWNDGAVWID